MARWDVKNPDPDDTMELTNEGWAARFDFSLDITRASHWYPDA
jgi:hypothetical protein